MRLAALALTLSAASFVLVNAAASLALALVARRHLRALGEWSADTLLALRLLPALAAAWTSLGVVLPAFLAHEPVDTREVIAPALAVTSALALWLTIGSLLRGALLFHATGRARRLWDRLGQRDGREAGLPVTRLPGPGPVAAVAGFLRHRLYVSDGLRRSLTTDEWALVRAHELAHAASGDNLKALVLRSAPDALGRLGAAPALERLWARAAEREADGAAVRVACSSPLELAEVLLKVARLAAPATPPGLVAHGFFGAEDLSSRVARLLDDGAREAPTRRHRAPLLAPAAAIAGLAALSPLWPQVHAALELVVASLQP
jgi:Zn-dependent protease with chaperone function